MGRQLVPFAMMAAFAPKTTEALNRMIDQMIPPDTSVDRKRRKERARMHSMQRQAELKANPKPPKHKRGKKGRK
jgi:hypothetical protein